MRTPARLGGHPIHPMLASPRTPPSDLVRLEIRCRIEASPTRLTAVSAYLGVRTEERRCRQISLSASRAAPGVFFLRAPRLADESGPGFFRLD